MSEGPGGREQFGGEFDHGRSEPIDLGPSGLEPNEIVPYPEAESSRKRRWEDAKRRLDGIFPRGDAKSESSQPDAWEMGGPPRTEIPEANAPLSIEPGGETADGPDDRPKGRKRVRERFREFFRKSGSQSESGEPDSGDAGNVGDEEGGVLDRLDDPEEARRAEQERQARQERKEAFDRWDRSERDPRDETLTMDPNDIFSAPVYEEDEEDVGSVYTEQELAELRRKYQYEIDRIKYDLLQDRPLTHKATENVTATLVSNPENSEMVDAIINELDLCLLTTLTRESQQPGHPATPYRDKLLPAHFAAALMKGRRFIRHARNAEQNKWQERKIWVGPAAEDGSQVVMVGEFWRDRSGLDGVLTGQKGESHLAWARLANFPGSVKDGKVVDGALGGKKGNELTSKVETWLDRPDVATSRWDGGDYEPLLEREPGDIALMPSHEHHHGDGPTGPPRGPKYKGPGRVDGDLDDLEAQMGSPGWTKGPPVAPKSRRELQNVYEGEFVDEPYAAQQPAQERNEDVVDAEIVPPREIEGNKPGVTEHSVDKGRPPEAELSQFSKLVDRVKQTDESFGVPVSGQITDVQFGRLLNELKTPADALGLSEAILLRARDRKGAGDAKYVVAGGVAKLEGGTPTENDMVKVLHRKWRELEKLERQKAAKSQ